MLLVAVSIFNIISFIVGLECPFKMFFDIPCPTCGVTRALLAFARMDITNYLNYNAMALFLVSAVLILISDEVIKLRKTARIYAYTVLAVNLIYYFARLFFFGFEL